MKPKGSPAKLTNSGPWGVSKTASSSGANASSPGRAISCDLAPSESATRGQQPTAGRAATSSSTSTALVLAGGSSSAADAALAPSLTALPSALPFLLASTAPHGPPPRWLGRIDAALIPLGDLPHDDRYISCLAVTAHHAVTREDRPGARSYVMYTITVRMPGEAAQGWRVARRFSQFAELHQELWAHHTTALQRSGASLPSKLRWPFGGLELEGMERRWPLDRYLKALMALEDLRQSEQLLHFLAAHTPPKRRRQWDAAVGRASTPR